MKTTLSGICTTTLWQKQEYSLVEQGPQLMVAEKESTITGGIEGKSTMRYSVVYMSDGARLFSGHVRITGRIGDRDGSFVMEETGIGSAEKTNGTWKILPDTATGDLVGLKGEGGWVWERGNKYETYTLTYEL